MLGIGDDGKLRKVGLERGEKTIELSCLGNHAGRVGLLVHGRIQNLAVKAIQAVRFDDVILGSDLYRQMG